MTRSPVNDMTDVAIILITITSWGILLGYLALERIWKEGP